MSRRLGERDSRLLEEIALYGHITLETLLQRRPELSQSAVGSWLKRLRKSGYLESAPLDQRRYYYRLSHKAVMHLRKRRGVRVSRAATRPLKPYRKPERHAFLLFTSVPSEVPRKPYRPSLDVARFGEINEVIRSGKADPLRQKLFFACGESVSYFVLDRGHPAFIQRKLKPKVVSLLGWPSFQRLIAEGTFRLTVITCSEGRQQELLAEIQREPPPFPIDVIVLEEVAALFPTRRLNSQPRLPKKETST